jgi:predicted phosphodiesterase
MTDTAINRADNVRIAYHSDLHLERSRIALDIAGADVVVLAGDILEAERAGPNKRTTVVDVIAQRLVPDEDTPVVFVPGNHDLVGNRWRDAIAVWKSVAEERYGGRVRVLVNETWMFRDVQFLGTPLWTDFNAGGTQQASMRAAKYSVCDFSTIFQEGGRLVTPEDWLAEHHRARRFLDEHLYPLTDEAKPDEPNSVPMPTQVVVTHWCPTPKAVQHRRMEAEDLVAPYWVAQDEDLVRRAGAWIFGHTHQSVDMHLSEHPNRGRLVSNARGSFALDDAADAGWRQNAFIDIQRPTRASEPGENAWHVSGRRIIFP